MVNKTKKKGNIFWLFFLSDNVIARQILIEYHSWRTEAASLFSPCTDMNSWVDPVVTTVTASGTVRVILFTVTFYLSVT